MFFAFPADIAYGKCVVITAYSQSDTAVTLVGDLRKREWIEIQVDNIVESTHYGAYFLLYLFFVLQWEMPQREAGKIANYKVAGPYRLHHYCVTLFRTYLGGYRFDSCHILCYFRTKIRTVNDAPVSIGVGPVHCVTVEGEGSTCFDCRSQHQSDNVFNAYTSFGKSSIVYTVMVSLFPFFSVIIFQAIPFDCHNLVRAE